MDLRRGGLRGSASSTRSSHTCTSARSAARQRGSRSGAGHAWRDGARGSVGVERSAGPRQRDARDVAPVAAPAARGWPAVMRLTPGGGPTPDGGCPERCSSTTGTRTPSGTSSRGFAAARATPPATPAADRARAEPRVPDRAGVGAPRRSSRRRTPCRTRASTLPSAARGGRSSAFPRDWDHVVHHPAAFDPEEQRFEGLRRYYEAAGKHFRGRRAVGVAGQAPPDYAPHQRLRLEAARARAGSRPHGLGGRRSIAVMPAGSGARYLYPSTTSWLTVLDELGRRFPDAAFASSGALGDGGGRTASGIARGEVDRLLASRRHAVDAFDRRILEQSPWSRRRASSSHRTRDSASPRWRSGRRG